MGWGAALFLFLILAAGAGGASPGVVDDPDDDDDPEPGVDPNLGRNPDTGEEDPGVVLAPGRTAVFSEIEDPLELVREACQRALGPGNPGVLLAPLSKDPVDLGDVQKAVMVGAFPDVDFPPPWNATETHIQQNNVVASFIAASAAQRELAVDKGGTLCEFILREEPPAPNPAPSFPPPTPQNMRPTPTPGSWYVIGMDDGLSGKGLLTHVGKAYGLKAGTAMRQRAAQGVNAAAANRELGTYTPTSTERQQKLYGDTILAFGGGSQGNLVFFPKAPDGGW